jgi:hypothetical protein
MSQTKNGCLRCDWCGKLTRSKSCEYVKANGSAGYINQPEWERFPGGDPTKPGPNGPDADKDICEECAEKHCCACGSTAIVVPDPAVWAGHCETCGYRWSLEE